MRERLLSDMEINAFLFSCACPFLGGKFIGTETSVFWYCEDALNYVYAAAKARKNSTENLRRSPVFILRQDRENATRLHFGQSVVDFFAFCPVFSIFHICMVLAFYVKSATFWKKKKLWAQKRECFPRLKWDFFTFCTPGKCFPFERPGNGKATPTQNSLSFVLDLQLSSSISFSRSFISTKKKCE